MARTHLYHNGERIIVEVVLSRRNLLAGLQKLDDPDSARMIQNNDSSFQGEPSGAVLLVLRFENDDEHYANREPGMMAPDAEEYIAENGGIPFILPEVLPPSPDSAPE